MNKIFADYFEALVSLDLTDRLKLALCLGVGAAIFYLSWRLIRVLWRLFGDRDEWLARIIACGFASSGLVMGTLMVSASLLAPVFVGLHGGQ